MGKVWGYLMLVKTKYNIGDKVKIQTQNYKGLVWYDCEIIGFQRKQIYIKIHITMSKKMILDHYSTLNQKYFLN